jgi:hypothetical protein
VIKDQRPPADTPDAVAKLRRRGEDRLQELARQFPANAGVVAGRMFNGQGLKVGDRFFAFVSHTGDLVIKVSRDEAAQLVDDHQAEPMTMGNRTMREWVRLPWPRDDQDHDHWPAMVQRAWRYAVDQAGSG